MSTRDDLTTIFTRNRRMAELNPDIAAETLAGSNSAIPAPQPNEKPRQAKSLSDGSGRPEPKISLTAQPHRPRKDYKAELVQQCELLGLKMEPEFKFHPNRKFRADWRVHYGIWEGKRPKKINHHVPSAVLVEYEGGLFSSGKRGHSSIAGIHRDIEKSNLAQIAGYIVIRVTPKHVISGEAVKWIMDALKREVICSHGLRQLVLRPDAAPF